MLSDLGQWRRAEELFHAALTRSAETRAAWLAEQCQDDPALAREVQDLIDAYEAQDQIHPEPPPAPRQLRFGPYHVDRKIGEGGMGAVYLAERSDGQFEQTVAIKVMTRAGASDLFVERFRLERQLLAGLNHPNISRLLDGGVTEDGLPYLAMEYVVGVRIDQHCDQKGLDTRARLRLFLLVCSAVQYAHRNLVVHRDLKPDNILVQDDGTPKLLDFGAAKLLTPATEKTESALTQVGFRAFTPAYASPEQVLGQNITTASDIYSLGVILYRLLSGRAPYELKEYNTAELLEVICRQDAPAPGLGADLDAIIGKCLRKDPLARYRSVDELIDDIGFYLEGRPVAARRGALPYRFWKFIQRNKVAAGAGALLAASLVLGIAGVLWEARIAQGRYQDLRRLTSSLLFELNGVIRDLPGSIAAQHLLVTRVLENLDRMAQGSTGDRLLQSDLVAAYRQMGNLQGNPYEQNLGDMQGGLATLRKALAISQALLARQPADRPTLRADALVRMNIGDILFGSGKPKEAIESGQRAAAALEKLANQPGASAESIMETAVCYETLGDEYGQSGTASLGDSRTALTQYEKAAALDQRALTVDPSFVRARRGIAVIQMKIGAVQLDTDPEKALESFLTALKTFDTLPEKEASNIGSRHIKSNLLRKAGDANRALEEWDAALEYYSQCLRTEEAFAAIDPDDSRAQLQLAVVLYNLGLAEQGKQDWTAAAQTFDRVLAIMEGLIRRDPHNPVWRGHWAGVLFSRAEVSKSMGAPAAEKSQEAQAMTAVRELAARPDASEIDLCRAGDHLSATDPQTALLYAGRCVDLSGRGNPDALRVLSAAYRAVGRLEEARAVAKEGLALLPPATGSRRGTLRRELEEAAK